MGIPVLFKNLVENYDDLLINAISSERINHNLYLDLNCAIHPCCRGEIDEGVMIEKIVKKIIELENLVNPEKEVFIAIDGVCPKAKMIQQRSRRHKSILENKPWDTNMISPGTPFMKKLSIVLKKIFTDKKYVISDSNEHGEGEHKILQRIKKNNDNINSVIYGLDADLIMLSLVSHKPNIFLLRERTEYNIENIPVNGEYIYMNIDSLKEEIYKSIPNIPKSVAIDDYIFITFFLGNDFIKNSPSLNLRYDGLNTLISLYNSVQKDYRYNFQIINRSTKDLINYEYLKRFLEKCEMNETDRMFRIFHIRKKQSNRCKAILSAIVDKNESTEYKEYNKPILNINQEYHIFRDKNWVKRYNEYLEYDTKTNSNLQSIQLPKEYIKSLLWTVHYYFNECIDWNYAYDFSHSPSLKDVKEYILHNDNIVLEKNNKKPCSKEQLLFIMPKETLKSLGMKSCNKFIPNEKFLLKRYGWEIH
jgi:5'-3' exonuclease